MGLDKELREAFAVFAVMTALRITVDLVTIDMSLSLEALLLRMIPGILGIGLMVHDALSLKTAVAWITWIAVTIIMLPVTQDLVEPLITVVLAVLIGAGRFFYDSNH